MGNRKLIKKMTALSLTCLLSLSLSLPPLSAAASEVSQEPAAGGAAEAENAETSAAENTEASGGTKDAGNAAAGDTGEAVNVTVTTEQKKRAQEEAVVKTAAETIKGHSLAAENESLALYLYEPALSILIRDKKTGAIMESTVSETDGTLNATWESFIQSGIGFEILNGVNEERTDLLAAQADIQVTKTENGFSAQVMLTKYQIAFTLNVTLEEDGIVAEIPNDSIREEKKDVTIGSIYVYPFLGYTWSSERDGYMLVPDGNGALLYLEDNDGRFTSPLTLKVWGDNAGVDESYVLSLFWDEYQTVNDAEPVLAPVYGMVHTDTKLACLSIIEEGAQDARIIAYPNGAVTNYNWITPKFTMRRIYKQLMSKEGTSAVQLQEDARTEYDIRVRYIFTDGEEADYAGLAVKYRDYLLNARQLPKKDDSFKIRLDFLGTDRENGMIFKKPVVMTTAENVRDIYADLKTAGVTDIFSIYKGWQDGGICSVPVSKYKADGKIGGTRALTELIKDSGKQGIDLYLWQDALRANPATVNTTFNVIKKLDESVYKEQTYKEIYEYFNYQTPDRAVKRLNKSLSSYDKKGVKNLALTGITNHLFSYSYNGKQYNRADTLSVFDGALRSMAEGRSVVMEEPLSCYWDLTQAVVGMPVNTSNYIFTDEEVPFLSIALKGVLPMYADYTNFEANEKEYFLQLVETGIFPSFYLTWEDPVDLLYTNSSDLYTSKYTVYREEIIDYYEKLKAVNEAVKGAFITDRTKTADNVAVVEYSNGVKIYVNYNSAPATCDGMTIDGMSYKVGETG